MNDKMSKIEYGLTYWTKKDLRHPNLVNQIIKFVSDLDESFLPTALYGGHLTKSKNDKFSNSNKDCLNKLFDCFLNKDVIYIVLTNRDRFKREMIFGFTFNIMRDFNVVCFNITRNYFSSKSGIQKYFETGMQLSQIVEPVYGLIHETSNFNEISLKPLNVFNRIPGAYWGNYFGKYYIEKIGREKLLSFESYKTKILENGDILILTTADPLNPKSKESIESRKRLYELINMEKDFKVAPIIQENVERKTFKFKASSIKDLKNILNKLIKKNRR